VASFEAELGEKLLDDYRQFLLETNGGVVAEANEWVPLTRSSRTGPFGDGFLVDLFFPVCDDNYPELELRSEFRDYSGRIPIHTLPIARNAFGDLILLVLRGAERGATYAWDHEAEGLSPSVDDPHNTYKMTASFSDLLNSLTSFPPS
jgi:hypothetical protein